MLLEGSGGKPAAAVARAEQAGGSPQECEPRRGARRPGLLLGSLPAPEAAAMGTRGELPWSRDGSPGRCGRRDPAAGDWSPPLQRQRLEKEGVRLWESRMRGQIRLGNQEKGREGERRLHMTSRSQ